jgi:hypothetical protein
MELRRLTPATSTFVESRCSILVSNGQPEQFELLSVLNSTIRLADFDARDDNGWFRERLALSVKIAGRASNETRGALGWLVLLAMCSAAFAQAPQKSPAAAGEGLNEPGAPVHQIAEDARTAMTPAATEREPESAVTAAQPNSPAPVSAARSLVPAGPTASSPANEPEKYNVALIGHRSVGTGLNFYSLEREMAVGQDLAKQVEQSSKLITDQEITEYINRVGQNLVKNSDSRVPFTIKVIDSGEINAFALPGGFFYVDSGLILAADSEAELAAIMAHEIAHVAARHATRNMTKQQIWNMASIPLMFVGGPAGLAIAEVASFAVPMSFLKFSRDSEREADMLGLQYDYAVGYDPQAFIQFFERLKAEEKQKHSKVGKLFSTHPMTADRITAAQDEIRTYFPDRDSYVVDTSEFDTMKARLSGLQGKHHLTTDKTGSRPVLRKHTEDAPDTTTVPAPSTSSADDTPTLKRADPNPS